MTGGAGKRESGHAMAIRPPNVYVRDTGSAKGRGVFAARRFGVGEVVEECPVLVIRKPYEALHRELKTFAFYWEVPGVKAAAQALAFGYGSLYNHANPANMRYEADAEARLMRFVAVREISPDEELTINYNADGGAALSNEDWWFEEKGIDMLSDP